MHFVLVVGCSALRGYTIVFIIRVIFVLDTYVNVIVLINKGCRMLL